MKTHIIYAVGQLERRSYGDGATWRIDDHLFATSVQGAEDMAKNNGGDMAMERWSIEAETAPEALVLLGNAMRGDNREGKVSREILETDGVGGEAW